MAVVGHQNDVIGLGDGGLYAGSWVIVIVISKLLKRYSKAKRTRAPAYSRALRQIKGDFSKGWSREAQVLFPEGQLGRDRTNERTGQRDDTRHRTHEPAL